MKYKKGFSQMNLVITPSHMKLLIERVAALMVINLHGPPLNQWDPAGYVITWLRCHRSDHPGPLWWFWLFWSSSLMKSQASNVSYPGVFYYGNTGCSALIIVGQCVCDLCMWIYAHDLRKKQCNNTLVFFFFMAEPSAVIILDLSHKFNFKFNIV